MADFSCEITVGGLPVQLAPREESAALRKANSVFCPLGPAPTRAWFVMLSKHAASLTSAATSVAWRQVGDGSKTLTFRGLYPVSAARVFPGAPGDPNGLVLVKLVDARALVAENSDAGKINANIRSYAHSEDYLSGTTGYTWTSLATELWNACGLLGAFPGLPYAPDGVPQNTRFWGVSAYRALCAVLDHLDCAIAHNPLAGTYSIVQLGAAQTIAANATTLVWDREPRGFNGDVAATVKIYAANHYRSYGQERDTERATNWSTDGAGSVSSNASGVTGAQGVRPLWDDLPRVLDENNTIENSAAISTRAAARAARYALRMGVDPKHRVHRGLLNDILPGAQVRAVLWRSWGDGTVTEFTAGADLVSGPDFAPLSLPAHENYLAPDLGRRSYPNYPRIANVVQVYHSAGTQGTTVSANADGFHPARVRRWVAGAMATLEDCWIRFIDDHDNADGDVDATDGEFYGPGRLCGIETSNGQTLPVYLVRKGSAEEPGIPFRNDSGETVPAYAVMKVVDQVDIGGTQHLTINKPDYTFQRRYLVNTGTAVANTETGKGNWLDESALVLYDESEGDPNGEEWGAWPGQWTLKKERLGFTLFKKSANGVALGAQREVVSLLGKFYDKLEQGQSAIFRIWMRYDGKKRDTQMMLTAYDWYLNKDETIAKNTQGELAWYSNKWHVRNAYCADDDTDDAAGGMMASMGTDGSGMDAASGSPGSSYGLPPPNFLSELDLILSGQG